MAPNLADWIAEADRAMRRDWLIDTRDAGFGVGELAKFAEVETPEGWVARIAEKYDFIRFDKADWLSP